MNHEPVPEATAQGPVTLVPRVIVDVLIVCLACLLACLYFLPTAIAFSRQVVDPGPTVLLNAFLGWTVVGWVIALRRALTEPVVTS